jgi:hypothetical protein
LEQTPRNNDAGQLDGAWRALQARAAELAAGLTAFTENEN